MKIPTSEAAWQSRVIGYAKAHGWRVHHTRTVRMPSGRYATPLQGHKGAPDLLLARSGVVLLPELKREDGKLDPDQVAWADAIGGQWRLWRPSDWPTIQVTLR